MSPNDNRPAPRPPRTNNIQRAAPGRATPQRAAAPSRRQPQQIPGNAPQRPARQSQPARPAGTSSRAAGSSAPGGAQGTQVPRRTQAQSRSAYEAAAAARRAQLIRRVSAAALLILLLLAVFLIGRACRGGLNSRGKYEINKSEETTAAEEDKAAPETLAVGALASAPDFDLQIESPCGIMVARDDGSVVAARLADERVYPASLTKIMSLIVALENCGSLDDTFTYTAEVISPFYAEGASLAGFSAGESVTLRDMLYGMVLESGADAAEGVARLIAGDRASFAELMNRKCAELGLTSTHFVNPEGLHDPEQYSTCRELAVILDWALKNDTGREILSTYKYTTAATEQHPEGIELTSDLQSRMEGGESGVARVIGGKTGYTVEAKNCLASFAKAYSDGREYIIVTCRGTGIWMPVFDCINACKIYLSDTGVTSS